MSAPRIRALQARHAELETALAQELARPMPNLLTVRLLKRRKLALKDELAAMVPDKTA
jgi:hypothetical protein